MKRPAAVALVAAAALSCALVVLAQDAKKPATGAAEYAVDPVHSVVLFRIKHLNVSYFHGRFNEVSGTFTLDAEHPAKSTIRVEVNAESVDTGNEARDKHIRSEELFDTDRHKTIRFVSKSVTKAGEHKYEAAGELTFHGTTRPLTVTIEHTGEGPGMRGETRSGFEAVFTVKRSEYGMTGLMGPLGDDVRLTVAVEGVRK